MLRAIIGKKLGMTSIFDEKGMVTPVTVIEAGPVTVIQVKTADKEGYCAVQIGFMDKKMQKATKPELGHAKKADTAPKKVLREVRVSAEEIGEYSPGQQIALADAGLEAGALVDVTGTSIGKGYAGVMKRHNFHGYKETHGAHEYKRHGGSIGTSATPGRVLKGKKMAGQLGDKKVTVKNLTIAEVRPDSNQIFIKGAVPGSDEAIVMIRASKKNKKNSEAAA